MSLRRFMPILLLVSIPATAPALAAKTDILVMGNGDRVTCEIKKLEHGKLTVKTDDMGTLQVKWDKIVRLTSASGFLVRTNDGSLHYGTLAEPGRDGLLVVTWMRTQTPVPMSAVTGLEQVKLGFWDNLTVALSLGLNSTKATSVTQFYYSADANYRGRVHGFGLSVDGNITDKGGDEELFRRYDAKFSHTRRINGRLWSDLSVGGQRNDELGLRLRALGGIGLNYRIVESGHSALLASTGLNVTREWSSDEAPAGNNLEGRLGTSFSVFAYDTPKTDVSIALNVYPNFTITGRVRSQLDVSARREVAKDLFVEIKYYESRDTDPPSETAAKVDRGLVFSLGWTK